VNLQFPDSINNCVVIIPHKYEKDSAGGVIVVPLRSCLFVSTYAQRRLSDKRQTTNALVRLRTSLVTCTIPSTQLFRSVNTIASFANAIWLMLCTATQLCHRFLLPCPRGTCTCRGGVLCHTCVPCVPHVGP
jgi:hypothetical protein